MTPEVKAAVDEIAVAFGSGGVEAVEDGQGGTFVTVGNMSLDGGPYEQATTSVSFQITHTYPYADVYPHFVRHDLSRRDGKPLGQGTSMGNFRGEPAIQISRRSNRLDPTTDTALLKLCKVMRWLKSRP
jgi:hypothetical protein